MSAVSGAGRWPSPWRTVRSVAELCLAVGSIGIVACAHPGASPGGATPAPQPDTSRTPPSPDPRVGLKAGLWDAGQAAWNMHLVSTTRPVKPFLGETNSDLAFIGNYAIQGNYNGVQIWDISNPSHPTLEDRVRLSGEPGRCLGLQESPLRIR